MLTSFFSSSKPLNFVIVAVYLLFFFILANFGSSFQASFGTISEEIFSFILLVLSLIVLNFIAKKNELTQRNSFKILFFAAFASMFLATIQHNDILISNFFILLALRRIISLRSQRDIKKKIFDATFWICISSIFYFWSILFLILVLLGILIYIRGSLKFWLLPILAILTVLSLATCVDLLLNNSFYILSEWYQESNFDFSAYKEISILIPTIFLGLLTFWTGLFYFGAIQRVSANLKASLVIVLIALLIALGVAVLGPTKNSGELLYAFAPLSIIATNYFQIPGNTWIKEILLILIVLFPFILWIGF